MRFAIGDTVETTVDAGARDWDKKAARERIDHWGKRGHVGNFSDAHGLIFRIFFEDGHAAWYEPGELRECAREVHYGTLTENACNQDHVGIVSQQVNLVTCPRCLEVLAAKTETVDHPAHYGGADDPYEAIKVIEAWGLGFNLGNTVKYIRRADSKGTPLEDLRKAAWYLQREIERRSK